ncbi:MAG: T9SS type A sorting domain-containing protein [candidate division WOR-3 bacterium]
MIILIIFNIFYNASIGYKGLASDFSNNGRELWVSFPIENKILNYETEIEINIKQPNVILNKNEFLYIVNNSDDIIHVYRNKIFSHNIKLPQGDYVSGFISGNSLFLLSREPSSIIRVNEDKVFTVIPISSYKPIDFRFYKDKFYILDRKGPAPNLRIMVFDKEGNYLATLVEIPKNLGGGIEIAEIDRKDLLFVTNSLMGKVYIYSLTPFAKIDSFGTYGDSIYEFKAPTKIKFIDNKLYILNQRNSRIDIFTFQNIYTTGISEKIGEPFDNIKILNNNLHLNLKIPDGNYTIHVFSLDGRKVMKIDNIKTINGLLKKEIPLSLKKGIYFVIIKEKEGKFIIQKGVNLK